MKLRLENIGPIASGVVEIGGITVIAGLNDTGKSTVGKALYSVIKAFSRAEEEYGSQQVAAVENLLNNIEIRFRTLPRSPDVESAYVLSVPRFKRARNGLLAAVQEGHTSNAQIKWLEQLKSVVNEMVETAAKSTRVNQSPFSRYFTNLQNALSNRDSSDPGVALWPLLYSAFGEDVVTKGKTLGTIGLGDVGSKASNCMFQLNRSGVISTTSIKVGQIPFVDCTLMESPHAFMFHDAILKSQSILDVVRQGRKKNARIGTPTVPAHVKDLFNKLETPIRIQPGPDSVDDVEDEMTKIRRTINGDYKYDRASRRFYFEKANGEFFGTESTATGIKTLGTLQILLFNGFMSEGNVIVMDEPEVHLHPKWQVFLARTLVGMQKKFGTTFVITSHSPYFLEAIDTFSREDGSVRTLFYKTLRREYGIDITPAQDDLSDIFIDLIQPFDDIEGVPSKPDKIGTSQIPSEKADGT